ncbi:hypothetical protein M0811_00201 [Anaeramoeba ignava]|uniref:Uncharacterized protein n=1 Tax=Anaeramoeba ignava TaxID=1746090 RepID=A0A9Q0LSY4_ANAIG|nr:hypothetical protein M0811_00201 [Anaeramoeba ignava]|eukprot:Anaeramoba_ignava/a625256_4.p1 GENE.a625256_4~~a625256_4.p1  ORF type:complete len:104 (+),score=29.70 a625256_4:9-320(+)
MDIRTDIQEVKKIVTEIFKDCIETCESNFENTNAKQSLVIKIEKFNWICDKLYSKIFHRLRMTLQCCKPGEFDETEYPNGNRKLDFEEPINENLVALKNALLN